MDFAWLSLRTTHGDGRIETTVWRGRDDQVSMSRVVRMLIPLSQADNRSQQEFEIAIWVNGSLEAASRQASLFGRLLDEHEGGLPGRMDLETLDTDRAP
jgi:hypothetical protein